MSQLGGQAPCHVCAVHQAHVRAPQQAGARKPWGSEITLLKINQEERRRDCPQGYFPLLVLGLLSLAERMNRFLNLSLDLCVPVRISETPEHFSSRAGAGGRGCCLTKRSPWPVGSPGLSAVTVGEASRGLQEPVLKSALASGWGWGCSSPEMGEPPRLRPQPASPPSGVGDHRVEEMLGSPGWQSTGLAGLGGCLHLPAPSCDLQSHTPAGQSPGLHAVSDGGC